MKMRKTGHRFPEVPTHHVTPINILREVLAARHSEADIKAALSQVVKRHRGIHERDALLEAAKLLGEIK